MRKMFGNDVQAGQRVTSPTLCQELSQSEGRSDKSSFCRHKGFEIGSGYMVYLHADGLAKAISDGVDVSTALWLDLAWPIEGLFFPNCPMQDKLLESVPQSRRRKVWLRTSQTKAARPICTSCTAHYIHAMEMP